MLIQEADRPDFWLDDQTGLLYQFDGRGNINDVLISPGSSFGPWSGPVFLFRCRSLDDLDEVGDDEIRLQDGRVLFIVQDKEIYYPGGHGFKTNLIEIVEDGEGKVIRRKSDGEVLFREDDSFEKLKDLFSGFREECKCESTEQEAGSYFSAEVLGHDLFIPGEINAVAVKSLSFCCCGDKEFPFREITLYLPATVGELSFEKDCLCECEYKGPRKIVVQEETQVKLVKEALVGMKVSSEDRTVEIYLKDESRVTLELQKFVQPGKRDFVSGAKSFLKNFSRRLVYLVQLLCKAARHIFEVVRNKFKSDGSIAECEQSFPERKAENVEDLNNGGANYRSTKGNQVSEEIPLREDTYESSIENE